MSNRNTAVWAVVCIAVLVGAYALGLGVRHIRQADTEATDTPEPPQQAEQPEVRAPAPEPIVRMPAEQNEPEVVVAEDPQPAPEPVEDEPEPQPEPIDVASRLQQLGAMQGLAGWQQVWADLNLTEEEQARLREGFRLMRERWNNMTEEEREMERQRLRGMWQRWQGMSERERQETMERMRTRFDDWRRSGRTELPEISLD